MERFEQQTSYVGHAERRAEVGSSSCSCTEAANAYLRAFRASSKTMSPMMTIICAMTMGTMYLHMCIRMMS